jgi:pyrroline-5-carboxylate reductase
MGGAMLRSWLENDLISNCYIVAPRGVPETFSTAKNVTACDAQDLSEKSLDAIIVAVKPQVIIEACMPVSKAIGSSVPIISIAAGKSLSRIESCFDNNTPIIRTMPNTPSAIGKGACVAIGNHHVTHEQKDMATTLLGVTGLIEWIKDEGLMDAVTAVSGSGPAYIFYLIEALANAGENAGLNKDMAMRLARQTVIGSAALADHESDVAASTLRENVTSPNGTTKAALNVLMDGRMKSIFEEAILAAKNRAEELNV